MAKEHASRRLRLSDLGPVLKPGHNHQPPRRGVVQLPRVYACDLRRTPSGTHMSRALPGVSLANPASATPTMRNGKLLSRMVFPSASSEPPNLLCQYP